MRTPGLGTGRGCFAASVMLAAVLAAATSAWACVPQPLLTIEPRSSGPSGGEVTVEGVNFTGTTEFRWNTLDGSLLGSATGPTFSVVITVPQASPGLYVLVAVERNPNGGMGNLSRAGFQIDGGPPIRSGSIPDTADGASSSSSGATLLVVGGTLGLVVGGAAAAGVARRRRRASMAT